MKSFLKYIGGLAESKMTKSTNVVVTFGRWRFNPITTGHELLINRVIFEANKRKALPIVYASTSHDPKKNPLKFKDKVRLLMKAFPKAHISDDASLKNIFQVAADLNDKGVKSFTLVVGSDRVKEFDSQLRKYVNTGNSSLNLQFNHFEVISAGQRDEDADDVSGMSASKMRAFVLADNLREFSKGLPKKLKGDAERIFNLVKTGMKL